MANTHFLTGAISGAGTLSGGSWNSSYPLSNILTTQPGRVARTSNDSESSTQFVLDLASALSLQMFALINHNLSAGSTVRFRVSNNSDGSSPSLDETVPIDATSVVWGSRAWGSFPWKGFDGDPLGGYVNFYLHGSEVSGRYVLVDISDESNVDGYVEIGCFLAGVPFVPAVNISFGASLGVVDESLAERGVGGGLYAQQKPKRRRVAALLDYLTEDEALDDLFDLQDHVGRSKGVLFILDPDETPSTRQRRTLYGSFTELGAIEHRSPHQAPYAWSFALEELIPL